MHVPEPVIQLMIKPVDNKAQINMSKALALYPEDPTFRTFRPGKRRNNRGRDG